MLSLSFLEKQHKIQAWVEEVLQILNSVGPKLGKKSSVLDVASFFPVKLKRKNIALKQRTVKINDCSLTACSERRRPARLPGTGNQASKISSRFNVSVGVLVSSFAAHLLLSLYKVAAPEVRNSILVQLLWVQIPFPLQICRMTWRKFNNLPGPLFHPL